MIFIIFMKNTPNYFWANQKSITMRILFPLFVLLLPIMGQAHPGHGASNGHNAVHYLLSSGHAGPAILLLTALCLYLILRNPKAQHQRAKR